MHTFTVVCGAKPREILCMVVLVKCSVCVYLCEEGERNGGGRREGEREKEREREKGEQWISYS